MHDPLTQLSRTIASTHTLQIVEFQSNSVFHTALEERFERITRLARQLLRVRIAAITVLDDEKQWFKSVAGWNVSELPRSHSLCAKILGTKEVCVVPDLSEDYRFWDHPLVVQGPKLRFYAGYPLQDRDGQASATFCVFDTTPRTFSPDELQAFIDFGEIAQTELLTDQRNATVSELIAKLGVARRAAMIDPLTKVWNRQGAEHLLDSLLEEGASDSRGLSVCMADIDHFKRINDEFGHPVGDEFLRKLAARLVQALRPSDVVCRVGGDEFLLVLPDVVETDAAAIVDRVHQAASGKPIRTRKGNIETTLSIGYVVVEPTAKVSAGNLIERADQALLLAKQQGRNRVLAAGHGHSAA